MYCKELKLTIIDTPCEHEKVSMSIEYLCELKIFLDNQPVPVRKTLAESLTELQQILVQDRKEAIEKLSEELKNAGKILNGFNKAATKSHTNNSVNPQNREYKSKRKWT